jgi:hypothetical protein
VHEVFKDISALTTKVKVIAKEKEPTMPQSAKALSEQSEDMEQQLARY